MARSARRMVAVTTSGRAIMARWPVLTVVILASARSAMKRCRSGVTPHRDIYPFQLDFAPDALHKANISGGGPYGIIVAGSGVDGLVGPTTWFVDDLNAAFAAGGFPGAPYSEGYLDPPVGLREGLARDLLHL